MWGLRSSSSNGFIAYLSWNQAKTLLEYLYSEPFNSKDKQELFEEVYHNSDWFTSSSKLVLSMVLNYYNNFYSGTITVSEVLNQYYRRTGSTKLVLPLCGQYDVPQRSYTEYSGHPIQWYTLYRGYTLYRVTPYTVRLHLIQRSYILYR